MHRIIKIGLIILLLPNISFSKNSKEVQKVFEKEVKPHYYEDYKVIYTNGTEVNIFKSFAYVMDAEVCNLGHVSIYKGEIEGSYEAAKFNYFYIRNQYGKGGFVEDVDSVFLVKTLPNSQCNYLAFIGGYATAPFFIYDYTDTGYVEVFSTLDPTDFAFSLYCRGKERQESAEETTWCDNGGLQFENIDLNGDGYLDMKFSGIVKGYLNTSEIDTTSYFQKEVEMLFLFNPKSGVASWARYTLDTTKAKPFDYYELSQAQENKRGMEFMAQQALQRNSIVLIFVFILLVIFIVIIV